jgi:hypothetical protein
MYESYLHCKTQFLNCILSDYSFLNDFFIKQRTIIDWKFRNVNKIKKKGAEKSRPLKKSLKDLFVKLDG